MRTLFILPLLLLLGVLIAEESPRQLDPRVPADALQIVGQVAAQVPLKLADSQALLQALQTLGKAIEPPPAPAAAAKPESAKP